MLQTGSEFYLKCLSSRALFIAPINFDDDGKERKDLIEISHGKYHYTEIIFINMFQSSQQVNSRPISFDDDGKRERI